MIWITSDIHFNDSNIFNYQIERKYKYKNVKLMNRDIISYQNDTIKNNDIIYIIGDFICSKDKKFIVDVLHVLNGEKHILLGNHDVILKEFYYDNIKINNVILYNDIVELYYKNIYFYMYHYPLLEQPNYYNNSYHLFGHLHGKYKHVCDKAIDVSFNIYGFKFINIEYIINDLINL